MEYSERIANLEKFYDEGKLVQRDYGDGISCACLLTALVPEVLNVSMDKSRRDLVPADVLPPWTIGLVIHVADMASVSEFATVSRRFLRVARRFPVLGAEGWDKAKQRFAANIIERSVPLLLHKELPEVRALLVDVCNVLRGDPTRVSRAALVAGLEDAKVPHSESRDAGAVRLLEYAKDVFSGGYSTAYSLLVSYDVITESFLLALEEQCKLSAEDAA